MEKFKQIVSVSVLIAFIIIASRSSVSEFKNFINYLYNSEDVTANITGANFVWERHHSYCTVYYEYVVDTKQYSGNGSIDGSCPDSDGTIMVHYLKGHPEDSIIGFGVSGIVLPSAVIVFLLICAKKYRNKENRKSVCVFYIALGVIYLAITIALMVFAISTHLAYSRLFSVIFYASLTCIASGITYYNFRKYNLYKYGIPIEAKISYVEENMHMNSTNTIYRYSQSYTVLYTYEVDNNTYTGEQSFLASEGRQYKDKVTVPILYNQYKHHISCFDN
jgi:hypothetical protein